MLDKLRWPVLALAQPAAVQLSLFPDFAEPADELASEWDLALRLTEADRRQASPEQMLAVQRLDDLILAISGPKYFYYWTDEALVKSPKWEEIRAAAKEVAEAFGWKITHPGPPSGIYIGGSL